MRSSEREKDEISFIDTVFKIGREQNLEMVHIDPERRPVELIQLIDEETDFFAHYNGQVINHDVGETQSFDYMNDINISLRHYYPHDPNSDVNLNELGAASGEGRLVPVSLMSKDLMLDEILIGRFVAGLTKYNAHRDNCDFYIQILVMSVCGNGSFRENLTFQGTQIEPEIAEASISPRDFKLVSALFNAMEGSYGKTGLEFLTFEVLRNRYYLSEMAGKDIGTGMAYDAYLKLFGSYMGGILKGYKSQVEETAIRLIRDPSIDTPQ